MIKKFNKYKYLGSVVPEVPEFWEHIILDMLKALDKETRPWYLPKFMLENRDLFLIQQIKQKFGTLRVYHTFEDKKCKDIISKAEFLCNDTCEFCGTQGTVNVTIKNWVRNLCPECITKHRK